MDDGFTFQAILYKITSTVDGGWRISFDLPNSEREAIVKLAEVRDKVLQIGVVPGDRSNPEV